MDNNLEANTVDSTELLVEEVKPVTAVTIYKEHRAKMELIEQLKKEKGKKRGGKKRKKEKELEIYDDYLGNYDVIDHNGLNPFLREQSRLREGNLIPEELQLNLYNESGFL